LPTPTLLDYLATKWLPRLFGLIRLQPVRLLRPVHALCAVSVRDNAVLGYIFRDHMVTVIQLFCEPGHEEGLKVHMRGSVADRLKSLQHDPCDGF